MAQSKAWMLLFDSKIQSCLRFENNAHASYELFGSILLKGLSLAKRLSYLAQSCLVMHSTMQVRFMVTTFYVNFPLVIRFSVGS
jgi:hypothetical protein